MEEIFDMKRNVKCGLYFFAGTIIVLFVASFIYLLVFFQLLEGKLRPYAGMIWLYLCLFGYYAWVKYRTDWWDAIKGKTDDIK